MSEAAKYRAYWQDRAAYWEAQQNYAYAAICRHLVRVVGAWAREAQREAVAS